MPLSSLPNFLLISLLSSIITATIFTHSYSQCLLDQKTLLLELKNELIFDSSISEKLVEWNQTDDCCNWYGVECDGAGHVISLQLDDEGIYDGIGNSSTLFRLKYLEKLNLAYNDFNNAGIPRGIHNLTHLTHLNLSASFFGGQVPLELFSLRRLVSLDNSNDYLDIYFFNSWDVEPLKLEFPNLKMLLHNLTGLRELYLDTVDISSQKSEWSIILSSYLPNLRNLSLRYCGLSGPLDTSLSQLHSLSLLRLDHNNLSTPVPDFFANFSSLTTLSLHNCSLRGTLPHMIFQAPTLQYLDLSGNQQLSGAIPPFTETASFISIDLSSCKFTGLIPSTFANLTQLVSLDLSYNFFTGLIPSTFANLTQLVSLDLSINCFTGSLSSTIFTGLSNLANLNLGYNSFTGSIPQSLFALPSLRVIYLESNQFSGQVEEFAIVNASKLSVFDLSSNQFLGQNFTPGLLILSLANNSLSGTIPTSLCNATQLMVLDLSHNKLSGNIPPCLLQNNEIQLFNIGGNNMSGHIPDSFSPNCRLISFDLNNNTLEGKFPKSIENCNSLEFMNVGNNLINDSFPCMLPSLLSVIVLRSNRFHGELRCHHIWPNLQIIDLSSNNFSGSLKAVNFSSWGAMMLDSGAYNRSVSNYLTWSLDTYPIGVTITMKGLEVNIVKIWPDFTAVDFSSNNFHGEIPSAIGDLRSLRLLNLFHNAINGSIPKSFGKLGVLESLDLSVNQLTGTIPMELAGLTFLSTLNLSYNKLVGNIPSGRQLQTFSDDSFKGNPGLCLNRSCSNTDSNGSSPPEHENVEPKEIEWEYVWAAVGFVVGLGSIAWILLCCQSFRDKYFDKIEDVVEERLYGISRRRRRARRLVRTQGRR